MQRPLRFRALNLNPFEHGLGLYAGKTLEGRDFPAGKTVHAGVCSYEHLFRQDENTTRSIFSHLVFAALPKSG